MLRLRRGVMEVASAWVWVFSSSSGFSDVKGLEGGEVDSGFCVGGVRLSGCRGCRGGSVGVRLLF